MAKKRTRGDVIDEALMGLSAHGTHDLLSEPSSCGFPSRELMHYIRQAGTEVAAAIDEEYKPAHPATKQQDTIPDNEKSQQQKKQKTSKDSASPMEPLKCDLYNMLDGKALVAIGL